MSEAKSSVDRLVTHLCRTFAETFPMVQPSSASVGHLRYQLLHEDPSKGFKAPELVGYNSDFELSLALRGIKVLSTPPKYK